MIVFIIMFTCMTINIFNLSSPNYEIFSFVWNNLRMFRRQVKEENRRQKAGSYQTSKTTNVILLHMRSSRIYFPYYLIIEQIYRLSAICIMPLVRKKRNSAQIHNWYCSVVATKWIGISDSPTVAMQHICIVYIGDMSSRRKVNINFFISITFLSQMPMMATWIK